ncbi:MAG TPA: type II toxin-antitoxin system VapC family toxin [Allosphingosinicella sp.]|jgi:PIN domain nuclease of toxin-antitoxin system|nr:type II toxin-antitoxin system VapC family toxin [Allosphingosinicella sp.]
MRLLLDTHIALWAVTGDSRLSARARDLIEDPDNHSFVSVVTIWEIAIKHVLRRDEMPVAPARALELFQIASYAILPVEPGHAVAIADLPRHHSDPFDRMLVAQAMIEPLKLLTRDKKLAAYGSIILMA